MHIRAATESDAPAMESLVEDDFDASRLVRERTVLVAVENEEIVGFLSYDTWSETVHVSTMVGEPNVVETLLDEPRQFADSEGVPVEIVVPDFDTELQRIVVDAGFDRVGNGPLFDGEPSHRYRYNEP